jgi:hypothetical protein
MNPSTSRPGPTNAIEAEATGEQFLVASYHGVEFKLPADVEDWPLGLITNSVGIRDRKLVVDHGTVAQALRTLLGGGQWIDFVHAYPKRRDLAPASTCFARAAGFERRDDDLAFSALPRLLATLERYPDAVEATLLEAGVDYRDRWRLDDEGRRRLSLRRIHVLLSHADPDCPLGIAQNGGVRPLNGTEIVLMDLYEAITRQRHPSRPMTAEAIVERTSNAVNLEAERAKYRERHAKKHDRRSAAAELARSNAQPKGRTPA